MSTKHTSLRGSWRNSFVQKYLWLLFPTLFFISFVPTNQTGITNLYRLLIIVPLLLSVRLSDVALIWESSTARWFVFLCGWMVASLFFDGCAYKDVQLFWRILNILALFYLCFLYSCSDASKYLMIQEALLFFGFVGVMLILIDWDGFRYIVDNKGYYLESGRGIFDHHLEVGWVLGLLGIVSLNQFLNARGAFKISLSGALVFFFVIVILLVQARGGYVLFAIGAALLLLLSPGSRSQWLLISGTILVMACLLLFREESLALWRSVLDRGSSSRYPIWNNGISAVTGSVGSLLFGHGLSATTENMVKNFQVAHFHNFYINHTFYTGLIGLFLYIGLVVSALKKALRSRETIVWGVVLLAMQMAFITDGDRLAVNPSAMMLSFLLPLALVTFSPFQGAPRFVITLSVLKGRHLLVFSLTGLALIISLYGLNRDASKRIDEEFFVAKSMQAVVQLVPENSVISVEIKEWPKLFGHAMPVIVAGIERPLPWKYRCDAASDAWREGKEYLDHLFVSNRNVELKNIVREKQAGFFRLEADVFFEGRLLADLLIEKRLALKKGAETNWCSPSNR